VFSSLFTPSIEKPVMKIIQDARRALPVNDRVRLLPARPSESAPSADKEAQQ